MKHNKSSPVLVEEVPKSNPKSKIILIFVGLSLGALLSFVLFATGTPLLGTASKVEDIWDASSALWLMPAIFFFGAIIFRTCALLGKGQSHVKLFTSYFGIAGSLIPLILLAVWGLTGTPFNNYEETGNLRYFIYGAVPALSLFIFCSYLYFTIHNAKAERIEEEEE